MSLDDLEHSALRRALRGVREGAVFGAAVAALGAGASELLEAGRLGGVLLAVLVSAIGSAAVFALGMGIAGHAVGAVVGAVAGLNAGGHLARVFWGSSITSKVVSETAEFRTVILQESSPGRNIGLIAGLLIGAFLGSLCERILRSRVQRSPQDESGSEGPSTP